MPVKTPTPLDQPTRFDDSPEIAELLAPAPAARRAPVSTPAPQRAPVSTPVEHPAPPARPATNGTSARLSDDAATTEGLDEDWLRRQTRQANGNGVPKRRSADVPRRAAAEKTRTTSTTLPLPLLDDLQRARLAAEMRGERFNVQQRLNDAILALPVDPEAVLRALQRSRSQLNFGVGTDEDGFIDEGRFTFRVTRSAEQHLALIISGLYDRLGRRVHRQDLFALAMVSCTLRRDAA